MLLRSKVTLILALIFLAFLISRLVGFLRIFGEHAGIRITQEQIALAYTVTIPDNRPQVIPKIIHQVFHDWKNESMPADWDAVRQTCISMNEDWEYMLWTEESSRDFIREHYNSFLPTYNTYRYPVQRVDTIRYFLMLHYGGIYIDLDNGCLQPLTPLLYYPLFTTDGGHGALSNNILGSVPNHPFFHLLTQSLILYNYNYLFPYITISYATGQWFLTAIWEVYHSKLRVGNGEGKWYRVLMDSRPGTPEWVFWSQGRGGSWLNWDNGVFVWVGDHLVLLGMGIIGVVGMGFWGAVRWRERVYKMISSN